MTDTAAASSGATTEREAARLAAPWWALLATGIAWLVYAWIVLSFDFRTVLAVAVFTGVGLVLYGAGSLLVAGLVPELRVLNAVIGLLAVAAGVAAFVWPGITFRALAALLAWFLLFRGVTDVVVSLLVKEDDDLWWLWLLVGVAEILVGFWAIGYEGRSLALLVIWVAATGLARGITDVVLAFRLRRLQQ